MPPVCEMETSLFTGKNHFISFKICPHFNVCSLAGMSRSVTVAVAYIMSVTTLNWKDALKVVRAGRNVANPNLGFLKQLEEFECTRLIEVLSVLPHFPPQLMQSFSSGTSKVERTLPQFGVGLQGPGAMRSDAQQLRRTLAIKKHL